MNHNKFDYTYSAPTEQERREIDSIKRQYLAKSEKEEKLERLRKLNARVTSIPQIISLCMGIFGTLIFGLGLTMILLWNLTVVGIIVMLLSLPIILVAYPVYGFVLNEYKTKYRDEILKLSDELLSQSNM